MKVYDEKALGDVVVLLREGPWTVGELAERFERSEKTIKRWLMELRSRGFRVVREGVTTDSPYAIVPAPTN